MTAKPCAQSVDFALVKAIVNAESISHVHLMKTISYWFYLQVHSTYWSSLPGQLIGKKKCEICFGTINFWQSKLNFKTSALLLEFWRSKTTLCKFLTDSTRLSLLLHPISLILYLWVKSKSLVLVCRHFPSSSFILLSLTDYLLLRIDSLMVVRPSVIQFINKLST